MQPKLSFQSFLLDNKVNIRLFRLNCSYPYTSWKYPVSHPKSYEELVASIVSRNTPGSIIVHAFLWENALQYTDVLWWRDLENRWKTLLRSSRITSADQINFNLTLPIFTNLPKGL